MEESLITDLNKSSENSNPCNYLLKARNLNILSSDQSKCQDIVSSALKLFQFRRISDGESYDGETAASRKLTVHLITIEQSSNQSCTKFLTNKIILQMQILGMMVASDQPNLGRNNYICGSISSEDEKHLTSLQNNLKRQRNAKNETRSTILIVVGVH